MHLINIEIDDVVQGVTNTLLFRHIAPANHLFLGSLCIIEQNKNMSSSTHLSGLFMINIDLMLDLMAAIVPRVQADHDFTAPAVRPPTM